MSGFVLGASQLNVILNVVTILLGGGALGIILKYKLGSRKLDLEGEEAIRDHYAQEVKRYADEVERVTARQLECEDRETKLRARVTELEDQVRGLKDQVRLQAADHVIELEERPPPSESAPHSLAAAKRIKDMKDNGK